MSINLNDSSFDGGTTIIFNGGEAGIVENVKVSVEKKKPEDKENSPEYRLVFTDEKGGTCNTSFWYVDKATDYNSVEELIMKQGKALKHIIHAIYGASFNIPPVETAKQMLDACMKIIREGLATAPNFRMFANYGTNSSPKQYIQPRSWVPFMEPMTVSLEESRLEPGNLDCLVRLTPSNNGVKAETAKVATASDDDWD
jgi:hypothetical protein